MILVVYLICILQTGFPSKCASGWEVWGLESKKRPDILKIMENTEDWTKLAEAMKSLKPAALPASPPRKRTIQDAYVIFADFPNWEEFLEAIQEKRCAENMRTDEEIHPIQKQ
jgi:hypothetical protein